VHVLEGYRQDTKNRREGAFLHFSAKEKSAQKLVTKENKTMKNHGQVSIQETSSVGMNHLPTTTIGMYAPPLSTCTISTTLSVDELMMGKILMSLKQDTFIKDFQSKNPPTTTIGTTKNTSKVMPSMMRNKMDLSVAMPTQTSSFEPPSLNTVSPLASTMYGGNQRPLIPPTQSPSERGKRYGPVVQLEDLRKCFNMPIAAVAKKFGICATLLKKICRRYGIQRWPHRQIRSLQKSIDMLRESLQVAKGTNKEYIAKKIAAFEYTLECIMRDPNTAAKGISAGRLASPASEEMIRRGGSRPKAKKTSPTKSSPEEEEEAEVDENDHHHQVPSDEYVTNKIEATQEQMLVEEESVVVEEEPVKQEDPKGPSMSLKSILC
jgi:hypothetical protein